MVCTLLAGIAASDCAQPTPARPSPQVPPHERQTRVPGEYIVTLAPGIDAAVLHEVYGGFGIKRVQPLAPNVFLLALEKDPGLEKIDALRGRGLMIKAVQPNVGYRVQ